MSKVEKKLTQAAKDCRHDWSAWKIIEYTGDWFHPHVVERKCEKCGHSETDEH